MMPSMEYAHRWHVAQRSNGWRKVPHPFLACWIFYRDGAALLSVECDDPVEYLWAPCRPGGFTEAGGIAPTLEQAMARAEALLGSEVT